MPDTPEPLEFVGNKRKEPGCVVCGPKPPDRFASPPGRIAERCRKGSRGLLREARTSLCPRPSCLGFSCKNYAANRDGQQFCCTRTSEAALQAMQNSTTKPKMNRHVLAVIWSTAFLTIVPTIFYGALIIASGDLGGPLNLILVPMAGSIIGFVISLVVCLPFSLLANRFGLRRWQQVTGFLSSFSLLVVIALWVCYGITNSESPQVILLFVASHLCFYIVGGLFVYLCSLRLLGD